MNVGSLFTGCRGLDLGLEQAGLRTAWACESDPHCRTVIARHDPDLLVVPDVRDVDATLPWIDVLAGGFPCQDVSHAGLRAGLAVGTRSGLWFEFARAVRVLRPRVVLVENVPGLLTAGFGLVMADLAEAGYHARWACLRAADVGAPHGRERVFIVATDAERVRVGCGRRTPGSDHARAGTPERDGDGFDGSAEQRQAVAAAADSGRFGCEGRAGNGRPRATAADRVAWGVYEPAVRRWESVLGRAAPAPTDERGRLMPEFVEWMLGFPAGWTDGVSRTQRLKMLGNSVQVQCGELVGLAVVEIRATLGRAVCENIVDGDSSPVTDGGVVAVHDRLARPGTVVA